MVGIVVASHGQLAAEFVSTARQIVGEIPRIETCAVVPGASPEQLKQDLKRAVAAVDSGEGVLIFADLIGGSPCMQSLSLGDSLNVEVVTGVNLPMLLKACSMRSKGPVGVRELALELTLYGQRSITCATAALRARVSAA